jgi:L-fuconolactonase
VEAGVLPQRSDVSLPAVDAHQHFWDPSRVPLPWLKDEHAAIARAFEPAELAPQLAEAVVEETVVVQAANLDADTDAMLAWAARHDWIAAVVGWVPLLEPQRADERLDELSTESKLRGIRHLIHDEEDSHWILRAPVLESLALVEVSGLVLELPVVFPRHLGDVPELAQSFPRLRIVIDHLGKPPLGREGFQEWAAGLEAAAAFSNVVAKISGLNTATARADWGADDLVAAVEIAVRAFGPDRLLCGSDWPVSLLNGGDYVRVWTETRRALEQTAPEALDALLRDNARRIYRLGEPAALAPKEPGDGAH